MSKHISIIILFLTLGTLSIKAQPQLKSTIYIDSLKTAIKNMPDDNGNLKQLLTELKKNRKNLGEAYSTCLNLLLERVKKNPEKWALGEILYRLGFYYRKLHQYDKAIIYYEKALPYVKTMDNPKLLAKLYGEMGLISRKRDCNRKAIDYFLKSIEICKAKQFLREKAIAENGIGNVYLVQREYKKALKYFKTSLIYGLKTNNKYHNEISYGNIGETLISLNQPDSADYYIRKSLNLAKNRNAIVAEGICYQLLGQLYTSQLQYKKALKYFKAALVLQQKKKDKRYLSSTLIDYAEACVHNNQLDEAKKNLLAGLAIAKEIHSINYLIKGYQILYKVYYSTQNYKAAFEAMLKNKQYTDTLYNAETAKAVRDLEFKYQTKEKNHKIKLLNTQKQLAENDSKVQRILFVFISLSLVGLLLLLYYRYNNRKKITKELQEVNMMKSQFFSNVSHEFRTPLTLIKGPVENIIEKSDSPYVKNELEMVIRNSNRLLMLVDQLLDLSKIDAGRFSILAQQSDFSTHLKGIANSFNYIATQKNITYKKNINASGNVWFDVNIIEIIINNLLSNAFKYVHENGTVAFDTRVNKNSYEITISNSDCDLSYRELNFVFDRFYRAQSGAGGVEGTGVGLALVKELCALYKAEIKVKRDTENFIYFSLDIPTNFEHFSKDQIALVPIDINEEKKKETPSETNNINTEDIPDDNVPILLVVEDNSDMREYIYACFCKKYKILMAKDGKEGLEMAFNHIPDLIISDVMMPRLDGIGLCKAIKEDAKTNHIPLVLLTAKVGDESALKGLEVGADDYVAKPFNVKTLSAKISNLIATQTAMREKMQSEIVHTPIHTAIKSKSDEFTQRLQSVVEEHIYDSGFNTEIFAQKMMMSRTQLHRKLKAVTGLSTSAFIRVERVKKAAEILAQQDVNIADVCYAMGFNTASYFTKCFKEVMNVTPTEYMNQQKKKNENNI